VIYEDVKRWNVPRRSLALHFEDEEEPRGGVRGRRCRGGVGAALLRAEVDRDDAATRLVEMTDALLAGRTQRSSLASLSLADEHVRRAEALPSHGRRGRLPAAARPRPVAAGRSSDAVQRDVDGLAAVDRRLSWAGWRRGPWGRAGRTAAASAPAPRTSAVPYGIGG